MEEKKQAGQLKKVIGLFGGISLVAGMTRSDVIARLKGITCGFKNTSCPDQLARALEKSLQEG